MNGASGLIYAAIVAAWATFLVPRWLRRNEEVEHAREVDEINGVRVVSRRPRARQAPHEVIPELAIELPASAPNGSEPDEAANQPASRPAPSAAQRRRRILVVLLVLTVVGPASGMLPTNPVPRWLPLVPTGLLVGYLGLLAVTGPARRREAVVAQYRPRSNQRERTSQPHPNEVRHVESAAAEDTAVAAAPYDGADLLDTRPPSRRAKPPAADGSWEPVPVPLPTYVTKARAKRTARRIDLSTSGAWTAEPLPAPPAARAASGSEPGGDDEAAGPRSQPRAVGD